MYMIQSQSYQGRYLRLTCTQTVNDRANTSKIDWILESIGGNNCSVGPTTVTIANQLVYYKEAKPAAYGAFPVAQGMLHGSLTVRHKADGTLIVPLVLETALGGYGLKTESANWELTPTNRITTITAGSGTIGKKIKLALDRQYGDFTHTISYTLGDFTAWVDAEGQPSVEPVFLTGTDLEMLLPEDFYAQIPNADHGVGQLTCYTYSGSRQLGRDTCSFTALVDPLVCSPTVSGRVRDINPVTLALTGQETVLVRYHSAAECTMEASAKLGASMLRRTINASDGESRIFDDCQTDTFVFSVVDSRGLEATDQKVAEMVDYVPLTCNVSFKRMDPTSGKALLTVWGDCFQGNFGQVENTLTITCPQISKPLTPAMTERGYRLELELEGYEYNDCHIIDVTVEDQLETVTMEAALPVGLPVFDWGRQDFHFHVPVVTDSSVGGVFLRTAQPTGRNLQFQSRFTEKKAGSTASQSVFLFGMTAQGTVRLRQDGTAQWSGTENVSVQMDQTGQVILTLPGTETDRFVLLSAEFIGI